MLDVLKVRIYPNKEQQIALAKNFGCCRVFGNYYLNKTNTQYQETGKGLSYCDMAKDLTQLKKLVDYSWLQEATAATLQQSLKNLESAFKNFFEQRTRFPKFKSKHGKQSIRYQNIREEGLRILSTNTAGHAEIQACGETVRLVSTRCSKAGFCEARISRYSLA